MSDLKFREVEWLVEAPPGRLPYAFSKEEDLAIDAATVRFKEKRHRELALDWIEYHRARIKGIRRDAAVLIQQHRNEIERYERMLGITPEELKDAS